MLTQRMHSLKYKLLYKWPNCTKSIKIYSEDIRI